MTASRLSDYGAGAAETADADRERTGYECHAAGCESYAGVLNTICFEHQGHKQAGHYGARWGTVPDSRRCRYCGGRGRGGTSAAYQDRPWYCNQCGRLADEETIGGSD